MTDEDLIALLRDCSSDEAMWSRQAADRIEALVKERDDMEAEAHAHIEMWGKALREKNDAEAKVAKLVDALKLYSCEDGCNDCPEQERDRVSCGWTARAALAEIEGKK